MCTFITILLPKTANVERLCEIADAADRLLDPCTDRNITGHGFTPNELTYTTCGHCDCGTGLGQARQIDAGKAKDIAKAKKKGWSERRIERWLEQRWAAAMQREASNARAAEADAATWLELIGNWLDSGATDRVGVRVADVGSDPYPDRREPAALDKQTLCALESGVIYEFRANGD